MSRNIRSLCNTTHSNERYVPITGYRRHNYTRTKYINSLGHHKTIKVGKIFKLRLAKNLTSSSYRFIKYQGQPRADIHNFDEAAAVPISTLQTH